MKHYVQNYKWLLYVILTYKMILVVKVSQSCLTLQRHGLQPTRLLCPWSSLGQNAGVGNRSLLQGIFPTQEPRSPALQADSLPSEKPGKSKIVLS